VERVAQDKDATPRASRRWAVVRICLGTLQTSGAILTVGLLLSTGVGVLTTATAAITLTATVISLLLWGGKSSSVPFGWMAGRPD